MKRAQKIRDCGSYPSLRLRKDGTSYLSLDRCRDRCCSTCSRVRSRKIADRITTALKTCDQVRHLVLTIQSGEKPLAAQLDHLVASFRRLRQTKTWKQFVTGGLATLQLTHNTKTGRWHPHLHVLITGDYLPQSHVADAWETSSRGSRICHISAVHSRAQGAAYIAKYVACPPDMAQWPPPAVVEFSRAMRARRILIAFGSLSRLPMQPKDRDPDEGASKHLITLPILNASYRRGLPQAVLVVRWIHQTNPRAARLIDPLPPDTPKLTDAEVADVEAKIVQLCDYIYREIGRPPPSTPPPPKPPDPTLPFPKQPPREGMTPNE